MHVSYSVFNDPRDIEESSDQWISLTLETK